MKLATLRNGRIDGHLVVVSTDGRNCVAAGRIAPTLQAALDDWDEAEPRLRELGMKLDNAEIGAQPFVVADALAPLPRAYQFIDGSGYMAHLERVRTLKGSKDAELQSKKPLMYQGASDALLGWNDPITAPQADLAVDFEAELFAILGPVPMRSSAVTAGEAIRLIGLCNDISYRRLVYDDLHNGFGFFHAKPPSAFAPIVVTPDELGTDWRDSKAHLRVRVSINDKPFAKLDAGRDMDFSFADLVAAACDTRALSAGTILAGGTVSNRGIESAEAGGNSGYGCIAEARTVEKAQNGSARTPFLGESDTVRIEALTTGGTSLFGRIEQRVTFAV